MKPPDPTPDQPDHEMDAAGTMMDPSDAEALQKELSAEKERYLRLAADFNSFRKRTARDSEQRATTQKDALARELLVIVDNLERALTTGSSMPDEPLRRGVEMTRQQLLELLQRHGIEPDQTAGEPFNAHWHEAIGARFDPNQPDHVVLEVVQRGYRRRNEIIRPARVIINDHHLAGHGRHRG
ncbi:MAG: nucleotide exchange factor GrpE [Opitutaceae bacterium]|nr:nucleotide exchange factor GrpE [Opitutaceae bacterium]